MAVLYGGVVWVVMNRMQYYWMVRRKLLLSVYFFAESRLTQSCVPVHKIDQTDTCTDVRNTGESREEIDMPASVEETHPYTVDPALRTHVVFFFRGVPNKGKCRHFSGDNNSPSPGLMEAYHRSN